MRGKNNWTCFLLILAGIVIGGFIGMLTEGMSGLSWLNYGKTFGLTSPLILDLGIIALTFAVTIKVTIASIIGIVIGILIYRKL